MAPSHRLARLLEMVTLFQGGADWGPKDLAARFGISETRIYDDIRELNLAGIPVSFHATGYRLPPDSFLPALNLTPQDVMDLLYPQALFDASDPSRLRALQAKVLNALPPELREPHEEVLGRTDVDTGSATPRDGIFKMLHRAIAEMRRLQIVYYDFQASETSGREIEPYGLIYRRNAWYCVAHCRRHDEVRKFRLNRIREAKLTSHHFELPRDFSLCEFMSGSWELFSGEPMEVLIRFSPRIAPLIVERAPKPGESIQPFSDGSILYRVKVKGIEEIGWWVIQFGHEAEVLRPVELRSKLFEIANRLVALYGAGEGLGGLPRVAEPPLPYQVEQRERTDRPESEK